MVTCPNYAEGEKMKSLTLHTMAASELLGVLEAMCVVDDHCGGLGDDQDFAGGSNPH